MATKFISSFKNNHKKNVYDLLKYCYLTCRCFSKKRRLKELRTPIINCPRTNSWTVIKRKVLLCYLYTAQIVFDRIFCEGKLKVVLTKKCFQCVSRQMSNFSFELAWFEADSFVHLVLLVLRMLCEGCYRISGRKRFHCAVWIQCVHSNFSTAVTFGTEESGSCGDVVVMGR